MHTVELLEQLISVAQQLGYRTRLEWLGGTGGGTCQLRGSKWIFIDLALTSSEQLEQMIEALHCDPAIHLAELPEPARQILGIRRAA